MRLRLIAALGVTLAGAVVGSLVLPRYRNRAHLSAIADRAATPQPGTYEIELCRGGCANGRLVHGYLVLLDQPIDPALFPAPAWRDLAGSYVYLERSGPPNGCYALSRTSGAPGSFAGIDSIGLTHWTLSFREPLAKLSLYRSPDAGYDIYIGQSAGNLLGRGGSWGFGHWRPDRLVDVVRGRWVGPADPRRCLHPPPTPSSERGSA
jgi:hypothetical protein